MAVLLGNGDGTFGLPKSTQIFSNPDSPGPPIGVADFNGDGKLDLVLGVNNGSTAGGAGDSVVILTGNGDGTFTYPASGGEKGDSLNDPKRNP
jgi:hypothetical protein